LTVLSALFISAGRDKSLHPRDMRRVKALDHLEG